VNRITIMKTKIALITGGYTGEAEVSYKSAAFVASQLDIAVVMH